METERERIIRSGITVPEDAPVIALYLSDDSDDVTYFFSDEDADAAITPAMRRATRDAIGAWSDVDADDLFTALDGIRHESPPTPPIAFDLEPELSVEIDLWDFVHRLDAAGVWYRIDHVRDAIMVSTALPGERWEIEFFPNGQVCVERFVSTGVIASGETIETLIESLSRDAEPQ